MRRGGIRDRGHERATTRRVELSKGEGVVALKVELSRGEGVVVRKGEGEVEGR